MANPWHHAVSSARRWGGLPSDYLTIHQWFDESKGHLADFRHRALRHHTQGIVDCERVFGPTVKLTGTHKLVPTKWVGEQHVQEDLGRIPTLADWLMMIQPQPWMNRSQRLSRILEREEEAHEHERREDGSRQGSRHPSEASTT